MLEMASGWQVQIDYSPEWIFIRFESQGVVDARPPLYESFWSIAQQQQVNRFVCELGESVWMNSYLIGQLITLHKRASLGGGVLRLCGLSDDNHRVLRFSGLGDRFPNYATREDAVMGYLPRKPR